MTNTEKYLDSIDGPADEDLADVAEAEDSADDLDGGDDFSLDFDSNYEDDRYSQGRNGMPSWSLFS